MTTGDDGRRRYQSLPERYCANIRERLAVATRRYGATVSEDLFGNVTSAQSDATSGGSLDTPNPDAPLAVRLRPRTIDEIVGQQHLLTPGSPLRRLAEALRAEQHAPREWLQLRVGQVIFAPCGLAQLLGPS